VNRAEREQKVAMALPEGVDSASAEVLFENRSVAVKGRAVSDTFGRFERHVYRFALKK